MVSIFVKLIEDIIVFIIAIILIAVTASYAVGAASNVTKIPNWKNNSKLASAHSYLSWAATIGWIYIGIIVLLIVLLIIFALTGLVDFGISDILLLKFLPIILMLVNIATVAVLVTIGVLCTLGAIDISLADVPDTYGSETDAWTATIVSIGSLTLVLTFIIVSFVIKQQKKKKKAAEEKEIKAEIIQKLATAKQ